MTDTIRFSDHDPRWSGWFQTLRAQLAPPLADLPVSVEHVGSTSVPGCAAKPIIDVDVVVDDRPTRRCAPEALPLPDASTTPFGRRPATEAPAFRRLHHTVQGTARPRR